MIREKKKETCFAIGVAETIDTGFVRSLCEKTFTDVSVLEGKTYEVMQASDLLMVASGTATLEAAVLGIPMSIIYKTSPLTWALAKALIKVKSVGLVNIIAGRRVVPEFIQFQATPKKICDQILSLLSDRERMEETRNALSEVRSRLGNPGASRRAAEIILNLSEKRCSMNASR
jgi:lipid-A-disaccharide synthase